MNGSKSFFILIIIGLMAGFSSAQTYNFKHFSVEDGLAQNQVLSVFQDSKGYMWFGTNQGGVSTFDGVKFRTLNDKDGLINNVVFSIAEDHQNRMYFGTNGGLSVLSDNIYTNYTKDQGLKHNRVFKVLCDKNNNVWLGTSVGVFQIFEDSLIEFTKDSVLQSLMIYNIYEDTKGNIWFCTYQKGICKYDGVKTTWYGEQEGILHSFVKTIVEDRHGNYWIGSAKGFNILYPDGKVGEKRVRANEEILTINSSLIDTKGTLWFGTEYGIVKYENDSFVRFIEDNGLISNSILNLANDNEGNLWFGSNGKGVGKFNKNGEIFSNYSQKDGLSNDIVYSILESQNGNFWIGSESGVVRKSETGFKTYTNKETNTNMILGVAVYLRQILQSSNGTLWFASEQEGVYSYENEKFNLYTIADGLNHNLCLTIEEDDRNRIWVGTEKGVNIIDIDKTISSFEELGDKRVNSIYQDSRGKFWLATEHGVAMYDGTSVQYFDEKDGFIEKRVKKVVEDNKGNLWFSTNFGIFRYDHHKFIQITTEDGLISNTIFSILVSKKGDLWIGTHKGIQRIDLAEFEDSGKIVSKSYGAKEGFIGVECNSNAIYEDSEGKIWFGTVKGVTIFDPKLESINKLEPQTHVTDLRLEFEEYDWSPHSDTIDHYTGLPVNMVLPYEKNHLSFDFIGISHTAPEKVKYQFMLYPLDETWLHVTDKNEAVYPHIPPGEYTFMVRAMNNDGVWNAQPAEFSFVILPPWYKTWWFYTLCFVFLFSSIYAVFVIRMKQLKKQKEVLEHQVEERTKELREEKEKVELINIEVLEKNEIIEEKNTEIMDSINYAKGIQDAILTSKERIKEHLPNSFVLFRPKDVVSGDFYWMDHKDNISFFTAADCTGHGVPGAFVSMVGVNGLNRSVNGFELREPAKMLDLLRKLVKETFKERKDGMDMGLCALNKEENILQYAGANNPLWVIRAPGKNLEVNGEEKEPNLELEYNLFEVKANKQPVGSFENAHPFTNNTVKVQPGDAIYVFSDGYPDQFGGPKGKKFMSKSLKKLLLSIYDKPMDEQEGILNQRIEDWMEVGNIEQIDDICVFGVKV